MLTEIKIKNFKRLKDVTVPLSRTVVFIGPNNCGKTTALQALSLWDIGVRTWSLKRNGKSTPEKRYGVPINRRDLISIPVPYSKLLWHGLHVQIGKRDNQRTQKIRIEIIVSGVTNDKKWKCGLEFDFGNEESVFCRPIRQEGFESVPVSKAKLSEIPEAANGIKIVYLPPMSGLAAVEPLLQPGRINVLLGQGETAQVLRNLCYQIYENNGVNNIWDSLKEKIETLFGVELLPPKYITERGEITMEYKEHGISLDLSCSGRGLQQTLLLLSHLYANPGSILLLDEPDAHLEILRQREIYKVISEVANQNGSQVIAASHSEIVLSEAAAKGLVVAFVGNPHTLNDRGSQLLKSLSDIGWDQYYQAEQKGWIIYLESTSDLEILQSFAEKLNHQEAISILARPFFHPLSTNQPQKCREHFFGLCEAKKDLEGIAIFDRLDKELQEGSQLKELMWGKREIENYFCTKEVLLKYAMGDFDRSDLFQAKDAEKRKEVMIETISEVENALNVLAKPGMIPWSDDIKASDDFLDLIFKKYFSKLGLPLLLRKTDYHILAKLIDRIQIDDEVKEKLDAIVAVATRAKPQGE